MIKLMYRMVLVLIISLSVFSTACSSDLILRGFYNYNYHIKYEEKLCIHTRCIPS